MPEKLIPFEEAINIIISSIKRRTSKTRVFISPSIVGKILAENIKAPFDYPQYTYSAMDGFALRSEDTQKASSDKPILLKVVEEIPMGEKITRPVKEGEAFKINTGGILPPGADAVVEIEKVKFKDSQTIELYQPIPKGLNIRKKGEYAEKGEIVIPEGKELTPGDIGLLASFGYTNIQVYAPPKVAVLSTGSELLEPGRNLEEGKIFNANTYSLTSALMKEGFYAENLGTIQDNYEEIKRYLKETINFYDVFITTGGVSMGDKDFIKLLVKDLEMDVKFHKVRVKPGKPMLYATYDNGRRFFFGLPGNPVSCLVNFYLFVYPALRKLMVAKEIFKPQVKAILKEPFRRKNAQRREFIRVKVSFENGKIYAVPYKNVSSGDIISMSFANGLGIVYEGIKTINKGEPIEVILI